MSAGSQPHAHSATPPAHGGQPLPIQPVPEALELLERRRSLPLRSLVGPGPDAATLDRMLAVAARVPDHGRLVPWRFIVLEGAARVVAGDRLDALYARQTLERPAEKAHMWRDYLLRAPVTVVLVSRPDTAAKIPVFNQVLSAGAAGMNLMAAAEALGFSALWLLKWPGRDPEAAALLGVGAGESVAGFFHIGRPAERVADRPRPALDQVVTRFTP
ncbi:nitroreductase [Xanthobacter sp. V4C-4]|uniref:nitroreductase family protein n=1 Tax=Xanthobacter cornucopiae TaxID=3119924 RepID=UPI0037263F3E